MVFIISTAHGKTRVDFTHKGLVPEYECYGICEDAWGNYSNKSLYDLITIGKGHPNLKAKDGYTAEIVEKWKLKALR